MDAAFLALLVIVAVALAFDYTNGFHDAANAIAVAVSTKALTPRVALALAAVMNLVGALISTKVAKTVGEGIIDAPQGSAGLQIVFAALIGAITWNLITWYFGLPSSSSHALIGGLVGAALAGVPLGPVDGHPRQGRHPDGALAAGRASGSATCSCSPSCGPSGTRTSPRPTGLPATPRSSARGRMALGHGMQDAQKTMGIITLALFTAGEIDTFEVPAVGRSSPPPLAISAGTYSGGFRIMRTLGRRIIQLTPAGGFSAQTVASGVMITTATVFAVPVSTTHITTTSIMGVGATRRLSAVRWGVAGNIVLAWVVTLPAAGAVAARGLLPHPPHRRLTAGMTERRQEAVGRARDVVRPLAGGRHGAGVGDGVPRLDRRPGGPAVDRPGAGRVALGAAVDGHQLHADPGVAHPARRLARRPVRPAPRLRHRRRAGSPSPRCSAALAQDIGQLVAARALQGIGGALLTPGSLALIQSSFRHEDRARAIGLWSSLAGISGLIGPFLGGVLVDTVSWRLVFLINVPFAVVIVAVVRPARARRAVTRRPSRPVRRRSAPCSVRWPSAGSPTP